MPHEAAILMEKINEEDDEDGVPYFFNLADRSGRQFDKARDNLLRQQRRSPTGEKGSG